MSLIRDNSSNCEIFVGVIYDDAPIYQIEACICYLGFKSVILGHVDDDTPHYHFVINCGRPYLYSRLEKYLSGWFDKFSLFGCLDLESYQKYIRGLYE